MGIHSALKLADGLTVVTGEDFHFLLINDTGQTLLSAACSRITRQHGKTSSFLHLIFCRVTKNAGEAHPGTWMLNLL